MRYRAVLWDVGGTLVQHGIPTVESIRGRLDRASIAHRLLADEHILSTLNDFLKNERTLANAGRRTSGPRSVGRNNV
jgi:hypothetical protein